MSIKLYKKVRKEARKQMAKAFDKEVSIFNVMIHKKPKLMPKFIYVLPYMLVFKRKYWKLIFKNIK